MLCMHLLAKTLCIKGAVALVETSKVYNSKVKSWKGIIHLKRMYLQSQCRRPRSVLHMHREVSKSQMTTS